MIGIQHEYSCPFGVVAFHTLKVERADRRYLARLALLIFVPKGSFVGVFCLACREHKITIDIHR